MATFYTDPAITSRSYQQPDLLDTYARLMQIKSLQESRRTRDIQESEARLRLKALAQQQADAEAMRTAAAAGVSHMSLAGLPLAGGAAVSPAVGPPSDMTSFDRQAMLSSLAGNAPHLVPGAQTQFEAQDKADAAHQEALLQLKDKAASLDEKTLKNLKTRTDMMGSLAQSVIMNPASYASAKALAEQSGMVKPGQLPEQFTPQLLPQLQAWMNPARDVKDAITAEETKRHNKAMEEQPSEVKLAIAASGGDPEAALKRLDQSKAESRPIANLMTANDAKDIADAIENGDQPPTLSGLYRNAGPVRAELARRGVPLAKMETDWKATQKYVSTLNGSQQTRLRQAISTASDSLDKIEGLYADLQKAAPTGGFKAWNRAVLAGAKQLPGKAGSLATNLDAQIADLTSELGNVYMGGNSPTDHALSLAGKNLSGDWNKQTFEDALKQARANIKIRQNSITHSAPAGLSGTTNYLQAPPGATPEPTAAGGYTPPANAPRAVGPNGHEIVVDNGKWVDAKTGKPL